MTKQKIITTTPNQQILWSMVYLNTIPIRNLSHRIKNGNRENRQPVEPKSVKQQSHQNKTENILWGTIALLPYVAITIFGDLWNVTLVKSLNQHLGKT
jgi:hypothetical protein